LSREVADLHRQLDMMRPERDSLRVELHAVQAARDEIRQRLTEREAALIKTTLTGEASRHELERFRLAAVAVTQERDGLRETVKELEQKAGEFEQRTAELIERLHGCEERLEMSEGKLIVAIAERDVVAAELAALQKINGEQEAEGLSVKLSRLHEEIADLREKLSAAEDAQQTYKILIEDADRALSDGQAHIDDLTAERDGLLISLGRTSSRKGVSREVDELRESRDQLQMAVKRIEQELARNREYVHMVEAERDQLKAELDVARGVGRSGRKAAGESERSVDLRC